MQCQQNDSTILQSQPIFMAQISKTSFLCIFMMFKTPLTKKWSFHTCNLINMTTACFSNQMFSDILKRVHENVLTSLLCFTKKNLQINANKCFNKILQLTKFINKSNNTLKLSFKTNQPIIC